MRIVSLCIQRILIHSIVNGADLRVISYTLINTHIRQD